MQYQVFDTMARFQGLPNLGSGLSEYLLLPRLATGLGAGWLIRGPARIRWSGLGAQWPNFAHETVQINQRLQYRREGLMNMLLRNFFYAVGITFLCLLRGLDPQTAKFSDLVKMAQSGSATHLVAVITVMLIALEFVLRAPQSRPALRSKSTNTMSTYVELSDASPTAANAGSK